MYVAIIFIALFTFIFLLIIFSRNVSYDKVVSISIQDDNSGKSFTVEDNGEIKYITKILSGIERNLCRKYKYMLEEYGFTLTLKDKNGKTVDSFIVNSLHIVNGGSSYRNEENPMLYDYLKALKNKYTGIPKMPENTTLEFWIAENVENMDLSKHQVASNASEYKVENAFYGSGYSSAPHSEGNEIAPEHYVIYGVSPYPDNSTCGKYITKIEITDPSIYLYGLTVNCSAEQFINTFKSLGYEILYPEKTEKEINLLAIKTKDETAVAFIKDNSKARFKINPISMFVKLK